MIEIKFILDPELNVYDQLLNHVSAFAPTSWPLHAQEDEAPVTRVTPDTPVETEPTEPKKRGRKPKETAVAAKEEVASIAVPVIDEQDVADEAAEAASDVLTHDDVRAAVGEYTRKFGIVAAQKAIPALLGKPIAEIPDDQDSLRAAVAAIRDDMLEVKKASDIVASAGLFADEVVPAPVKEITEADVRDALMAYAAKYDVDDKMANTLIDGPDILKKTFGPAISALRLVPKDQASLRKAYDAINDATDNNWYNRKVVL
jgi:CBS domain-containing protein